MKKNSFCKMIVLFTGHRSILLTWNLSKEFDKFYSTEYLDFCQIIFGSDERSHKRNFFPCRVEDFINKQYQNLTNLHFTVNVLDNEIIFRESDRPLGKTSLKPLDQLVFMLICFKEGHSDVNRESFSGISRSNDENFTSSDEYYKTTVYLFKKYEIMPLLIKYLMIN